ncbi:porin family protein [Chryseolinea lacunae]|uniref:PorT family protein n=1 Tax=Chryseolinea lacunae TaxID=2801331 RepID=A0ABS1KNT9_9BACT|nr:porin family protein [Chryseolinea lacunae]MBL0740907.1 PorT family protein [Chryseolinea lacunae]
MRTALLLLFICTATVASAQIWYVGVKAGPTLSNYKTKTPWKEASNLGYTFGFTAFKQINSHVGVAFDLQYIQKGYYHKVCNTITDKLQAHYLEVPIVFDYTFILPGLKNLKLHGNVGVYTAYWLSGKYKTEGFDPGTTGDDFDFSQSGAKRFDFGPNVGGRLEYFLRNGSVSLDLRYELGLMDLQKKTNDDMNNVNRAFIIGFSYMKPIGN